MQKIRLDALLIERDLAESLADAQKWIMAGQVQVNGQMVWSPGQRVAADAAVTLEQGLRFVSRGGEKLEPALLAFGLGTLGGRVCADVGSSTGGFTDCLLQHGAGKVYAIDVGYGILHWKLRQDARVVMMERTNARHVSQLPEPVRLVTVDASFISLRVLLPVIRGWFAAEGDRVGDDPLGGNPSGGEVVALIKPQFEASRGEVSRGEGVIQDPAVHRQVLEDVLSFAHSQNYAIRGLVRSSLKGPKGNVEFLLHLAFPGGAEEESGQAMIDRALAIENLHG